MYMAFIKESNELSKLKLLFSKIEEQIINKNRMIFLPINKNGKLSRKIIKKLILILKKENIKKVILSNNLNNNELFKSKLKENTIEALDGTYTFKILLNEIIFFICKKTKNKNEKLKVCILMKSINTINKQIVLDLAQKVKSLHIVTNNKKEFIKVQELLFNEMGIIIKLSNSIEKNSSIIINMDYNDHELNQYNLPAQSIILNINEKVNINSKKFNGININDYNIIMPNKYKILDFSNKLIYEGLIYKLNYEDARKKVENDKIIIKDLIGERGIIEDFEYKKFKIY